MGVKLERDSGRGFGLKFPHRVCGLLRNASGLIGGRPFGRSGRAGEAVGTPRLVQFCHRLTGHRMGW